MGNLLSCLQPGYFDAGISNRMKSLDICLDGNKGAEDGLSIAGLGNIQYRHGGPE